jgi:hypothetical protein
MRSTTVIVMFLILGSMYPAGIASAQDVFIYPTKGQSGEQQERDKWECRSWATNQTGFDPVQGPRAVAPPDSNAPRRGGALRGAGRGAAVGAVGGAIGGDAGKGAAIGAAAGGMVGVMRRNDQRRQEQYEYQQRASQSQGEYDANKTAWTRALSACLSGRGYTVQ